MQTWWIIVGFALALVVVFIFIFIFTSEESKFGSTLESCPAKGGQCFTAKCGTGNAENFPIAIGNGCKINNNYQPYFYCCS